MRPQTVQPIPGVADGRINDTMNRLLTHASASLSECEPVIDEQLSALGGALTEQLLGMLRRRNGFYALESALHVFPTHSSQQQMGLDRWNQESLWRNLYGDLADGCLFFAEDVFGGQFCIKGNKIYIFDPETGGREYLADDIEDWAGKIISDYQLLTGHPLAHLWQKQHGQIPAGKRLLPKTPFVGGGEFELDNLYLADAIEGMRLRADIASQLQDLPDGSRVDFKVID